MDVDPPYVLFSEDARGEKVRIVTSNIDELLGLLLVLLSLDMGHLLYHWVLEQTEFLLPPKRQIVDISGKVRNEVPPLGLLALSKLVQQVRQQDMVLPVAMKFLAEVLGILLEELL